MKNSLGNKIRMARLLCHLTQDELSKVTGIDRARLSRIENNFVNPSDREKSSICSAIRVRSSKMGYDKAILMENLDDIA